MYNIMEAFLIKMPTGAKQQIACLFTINKYTAELKW